MGKVQEAQRILRALGLAPAQQNEMAAMTLLALCGVKARGTWEEASRTSLTVTKGIMQFVAKHYHRAYAPNTRETFRRQVLHQFVQAGIVDYNPDQPDLPVNSPRAHYAISRAALTAIRAFGTLRWSQAIRRFTGKQARLISGARQKRGRRMIPVKLSDGTLVELSPGKHNAVQAAVIHEFAPRFAPGATELILRFL